MANAVDREVSTDRGGAGFGVACRSLKRYKKSPQYLQDLARAIEHARRDEATAMTEAERRDARLRRMECEHERALLDAGDGPDVFGGLVHFERPTPD